MLPGISAAAAPEPTDVIGLSAETSILSGLGVATNYRADVTLNTVTAQNAVLCLFVFALAVPWLWQAVGLVAK